MGIYDREYYQGDQETRGFTFGGGQRMMVTNLVILNAAIFFVDLFLEGKLSSLLMLEADVYRRPWEFWQVLSYGFAHAGIWHVGLNMFMLWMFGRVVEDRLGRTEFLLFYLAAILFAGLTWLGLKDAWLLGTDAGRVYALDHPLSAVLGASGGVNAVFILFVLFYPRQTVYIWAVLPVPAWLIGGLIIGSDLLQGISGRAGTTAWQAHLGGAAFAFLYLQLRWNFTRLLPSKGRRKWKLPGRGPKLRLHDPATDDDTLEAEADRILAKVHREGEASLTGRERRLLEKYSRLTREKRR